MKTLINAVLIFACFTASAQRVEVHGDTLTYKGHEFFVGEVLKLGYGSKADKNFAFVLTNRMNLPHGPITAIGGGYECTMIGWRKFWGKYYVKAKLIGRHNRIFIDVMGATDNNEILL